MEDNISNLTSSAASGEADASVCSGAQILSPLLHEQYFGEIQKDITIIEENQPPPAKKRRNLPGNPDPSSEVIALSPKSLLATNRFLCEICNKGFQRDQNLQLHRRGHNLPWKLKQRTNEGFRKKVYICPEISCVHHDPSRALGDLTGVKKHFSRKHGEKKWKCDKCLRSYAVQSDWKAHSKICGTREYICDCGTLFTRRDSFITHRAFCDALAMENARTTSTLIQSNLPFLSPPRVTSTPLPPHHHHHHQQIFNPFALMQQLPSSIFSSPSDLNDLTNPQSELRTPDQNPSPNSSLVCYQPIAPLLEENDPAHEGATGATVDPHSLLIMDMMNSLYYSSPYPYVASSFVDHTNTTFCDLPSSKNDTGLDFYEEGMTRDFLGLRAIANGDSLNFGDHVNGHDQDQYYAQYSFQD